MKKFLQNKYIFAGVLVVCAFILGSLVEVFGFNFRAIFGTNDSFPFEYTGANITFDEAKYIGDLKIIYSTKNIEKISIQYEYEDVFGKFSSKSIEDTLYPQLNNDIISVKKKVKQIGISCEDQDCSEIVSGFSAENGFYFSFKRAYFLSATSLLIATIFVFFKKKIINKKLPLLFVISGFLMGSSFIVLQPAFTFYSWDDQIHFQRTIEVFYKSNTYSAGEFASIDVGNRFGRDSVNSIREADYLEGYVDGAPKTEVPVNGHFPGFSALPYFPGTAGYYLCKIVGLPYSVCFRIGKIFILLSYLLLVMFAIKRSRVGRLLLFVIALLPTNLFLASSYSYDYAVFGGLAVFFALLINILTDKDEKVDFNKILLMVSAVIFASSAKSLYAVFLLLLLFVPKDRFFDKFQRSTTKIAAVLLSILLFLAGFFASGAQNSGDIRGGNDVSTSEQISSVVQNPTEYAKVLWNNAGLTFFDKFLGESSLLNFAYIKNPNAVTITMKPNLYFLILVVLAATASIDTEDNNILKIKQRIPIISSILLVVVLIWSALYASFTPVGSKTINGVQGRYFNPMLWPLLLCLKPTHMEFLGDKDKYSFGIISVVCGIFVLFLCSTLISSYCL